MAPSLSGGVAFSRTVLKILVVLNILGALPLLAMFLGTFFFQDVVVTVFRGRPDADDATTLLLGIRLWVIVAIPIVPLIHRILARLIAIVETVALGDPFVPDNAVRLKQIAWAQLGLEVLSLVFGVFANALSRPGHVIEWSFSLTGWVAVLLLFVLARVFEEGTRMRADLEGTV